MDRLSDMRNRYDEDCVPEWLELAHTPPPVLFDVTDVMRLLRDPDVRATARLTVRVGGVAYDVTGASAVAHGTIVRLHLTRITPQETR